MSLIGVTSQYGSCNTSANKWKGLSSIFTTHVRKRRVQDRSESPLAKQSPLEQLPTPSLLDQPSTHSIVGQLPTKSLLEKLPTELYAVLLRYLNPGQGVLLSLTCKKLWSQVTVHASDMLHKSRRCTDLPETFAFLRLLEKDDKDSIMCTACLSLHPRFSDEEKKLMTLSIFNKGRPCSESLGSMSFGDIGNNEVVPREVIELILRESELGPGYGLGIDTLETFNDWVKYNPGKVPVFMSSEAVVAQSSHGIRCLLLRIIHKVEIDFRRDISQQVTASRVSGCGHCNAEEQNLMISKFQAIKTGNLEDSLEDSEGYITLPNSQGRYRCPNCPCDVEVMTAKKKNEVFGVAIVTAWRDLGPRGDHNSLLWQNTVKGYVPDDFDRMNPVTGSLFGNEDLKEVWAKATKEKVE